MSKQSEQMQKQHWYRQQQRRRAQAAVQNIVVGGGMEMGLWNPGIANNDRLIDANTWIPGLAAGCVVQPTNQGDNGGEKSGVRILNNSLITVQCHCQLSESGGDISLLTIPNRLPSLGITGNQQTVIGLSMKWNTGGFDSGTGFNAYPAARNQLSGFTPATLQIAQNLFSPRDSDGLITGNMGPGIKEFAFAYGDNSNTRLQIMNLGPGQWVDISFLSVWCVGNTASI